MGSVGASPAERGRRGSPHARCAALRRHAGRRHPHARPARDGGAGEALRPLSVDPLSDTRSVMLRLMRTALVFLAIAVTSECSWILAHDPPLPINGNTYVTCPGGFKCLADGQECPLTGTHCIDTPPSICSVPPCAMAKLRDGGAPRDASIDAALGALVDASNSSDARADR